jgi:hypothetical protein
MKPKFENIDLLRDFKCNINFDALQHTTVVSLKI